MTDFFREVDEDFRRDRVIALFKRYQNWVIGIALLIILGTAAWRVYDHFRVTADEAAGGRYEAALQALREGKSAQALTDLNALGQNGPKGYAALARLLAADETASHDQQAGIKAYDALIADPSYDPHLKDFAQLRTAFLRLDTEAPKVFTQRYAALAAADQPYRNSIRELLAVASLKDGDYTGAGRWLDEILADPSATEALRRRAGAYLALVRGGKLPGK
ncbi:MAG: tetratricopeptide repeat protein [Methylovirgula sp.]